MDISRLGVASAEFPEAVGDEAGPDDEGDRGDRPVAAQEVDGGEKEEGKLRGAADEELFGRDLGEGIFELLDEGFGFGGVGVEFGEGGLPVFLGFERLGTGLIEI